MILKYQYACTLQSCHHITFFPLSCSSACNFTVIINFMTIPICCHQVEAFLLDYSSKLALLLPLIHFQYQRCAEWKQSAQCWGTAERMSIPRYIISCPCLRNDFCSLDNEAEFCTSIQLWDIQIVSYITVKFNEYELVSQDSDQY